MIREILCFVGLHSWKPYPQKWKEAMEKVHSTKFKYYVCYHCMSGTWISEAKEK